MSGIAKLQYGSNDGLKCCAKDCPERSAECRLTCERWKEHRERALEEYAKRAKAGGTLLGSSRKQSMIRKSQRAKLRRG